MSRLNIECKNGDFSALAIEAYKEIKQSADLKAELVFITRSQMHALNLKMRGIDRVTDVLSFPALEGIRGKELKKEDFPLDTDEDGCILLGSIAVCKYKARKQAAEYGHGIERELNYLVLHGLLHLLGYDHQTDSDKAAMREIEERVMKRLNLTRDSV